MALSGALSPSERAPRGAVAFDLDGTLIDSVADIASSANHCLTTFGFSPRSQQEIRGFVGDGARCLLRRASGLREGDPVLDALFGAFCEHYPAHAAVETQLLPGAQAVLADLRPDYWLALCTNKPRRATEAVLAGLAIGDWFDAVVAAGDVPQSKPHPAPLLRVGELLGVARERLILVGDGPQDIGCARAAGCRSIGLREGVIVPVERLEAERPDALLALSEVAAMVRQWLPRTRPVG